VSWFGAIEGHEPAIGNGSRRLKQLFLQGFEAFVSGRVVWARAGGAAKMAVNNFFFLKF